MKLTKFVHSCVLVEHDGKTVLFDPGIFSWNSGVINVDALPALDAIVVTHMHPDHCGEPFVKALIAKFPDTQWFAPGDLHDTLQQWGASRVTNQSMDDMVIEEIDHALVTPFGAQPCKNLVAHWHGLVTHPGDSHEFTSSKDILLLPIQAPWGTTVKAVQLAKEFKPKYVLPIHDWMWRDEWRESSYDRLQQVFADGETSFLQPVDGQPIEVAL